jgi:hypothetical protein
MKITKRQLRRIIREASETAAEERGMAASYQRGYSDGWSTPRSPVTTGRDPEYLRGYEKGAADAEDASGEGKYIREAEGSTKKWDGDSALVGKQKSKLHDKLQKGIIDKVVKDREEREEEEREEKELGESVKITKRQLRRIIREEKERLLVEEDALGLERKILSDIKNGIRVAEVMPGGFSQNQLLEILRELAQDFNRYVDQQRGL